MKNFGIMINYSMVESIVVKIDVRVVTSSGIVFVVPS
jgi:hypothetical protein